jgi:hypothetical protein
MLWPFSELSKTVKCKPSFMLAPPSTKAEEKVREAHISCKERFFKVFWASLFKNGTARSSRNKYFFNDGILKFLGLKNN